MKNSKKISKFVYIIVSMLIAIVSTASAQTDFGGNVSLKKDAQGRKVDNALICQALVQRYGNPVLCGPQWEGKTFYQEFLHRSGVIEITRFVMRGDTGVFLDPDSGIPIYMNGCGNRIYPVEEAPQPIQQAPVYQQPAPVYQQPVYEQQTERRGPTDVVLTMFNNLFNGNTLNFQGGQGYGYEEQEYCPPQQYQPRQRYCPPVRQYEPRQRNVTRNYNRNVNINRNINRNININRNVNRSQQQPRQQRYCPPAQPRPRQGRGVTSRSGSGVGRGQQYDSNGNARSRSGGNSSRRSGGGNTSRSGSDRRR